MDPDQIGEQSTHLQLVALLMLVSESNLRCLMTKCITQIMQFNGVQIFGIEIASVTFPSVTPDDRPSVCFLFGSCKIDLPPFVNVVS